MTPVNRYELSRSLQRFRPIKLPAEGYRAAAVTVPVLIDNGTPAVWLTERAASLRAHPGQFAFPGGRIDPAETAAEAALRELREELGVHAHLGQIVGELDDFATKSGYVITPFVVWLGEFSGPLDPNPDEIAKVHTVTMDEVDAEPHFASDPWVEAPILQWPFRSLDIHAPTAAILYQFREVVLHGRHTRVAHHGQPVFAWQ
ncbi:coenzyme A pyrophosphatase [Gordonia paraffinivorans]|uniref:NUDIX hydrolase n=1 Tax=Gordonia paraffinivorans TaxID=175628 RepID=UPI000D604C85|nr:CoA pyrophosphatase [Gordonia paraffinivorans]MBY4575466.1 coenzyme A pyrophosphatase [Gordonia paraffinivorans]PWD41362.1 coenzyme A pyrophosphatase [Gordonia paraffinivorans]